MKKLDKDMDDFVLSELNILNCELQFARQQGDNVDFSLNRLMKQYFIVENFAKEGLAPAKFVETKESLKNLIALEFGKLDEKASQYAAQGRTYFHELPRTRQLKAFHTYLNQPEEN